MPSPENITYTTFQLGQYNFEVDAQKSTVQLDDSTLIDITIKASEEEFERLSEDEDFEFEWGLYSPEFYIHGLEIKTGESVQITEDNIEEFEVALYFMEHCDSLVKIERMGSSIQVEGKVDVFGVDYPIRIDLHFE